MVLWANAARGSAELNYCEDVALWTPRIEGLRAWVLDKLAAELSRAEIARHRMGPGEWKEQEAINDCWDQEAAVSLGWALGLLDEYPAWDQPGEMPVDFFEYPAPESWRPDLSLRSPEEIENQAMIVETHYWRIRVPDRKPSGTEYGRKLMGRAAALGHVRLAEDGDLALSDGSSFKGLSEEDLDTLRSVQTERLQGLNWLSGHDEDWDNVTSDTIVSWLWDKETAARPAEQEEGVRWLVERG